MLKIRAFNRFYTNIISIIDQDAMNSGFSLAEARVLFEIKRSQPCPATKVKGQLNIDEGYLSRIVNKFVHNGWVDRAPAAHDKRQRHLVLSVEGEKQYQRIDQHANQSAMNMTAHLDDELLSHLLSSMEHIEQLLNPVQHEGNPQ